MNVRQVKIFNVALATWSGGMLVLFPAATNAFLGNTHALLGLMVGLSSLLYAAHVLSTLIRARTARWELLSFIVGDLLWIAATLFALMNETMISTEHGRLVASLVAVGVAISGFTYARDYYRQSL